MRRNALRLLAPYLCALRGLGKLCTKEKLWGKAQSYIEASLSIEPSRAAHAAYAQLMDKMGKPEEALHYNRRKR